MNRLDLSYCDLLSEIIKFGVRKQTRNGETLSVFGRQIRHNMSNGFPLLTTKKMYWKGIVTELLWFLRGDTNIKYLVDNDCHIWDGDAYKKFFTEASKIKVAYECGDLIGTSPYVEEIFSDSDKLIILTKEEFINKIKTDNSFAKKWGELGPIYGHQWRNWGYRQHDSIGNEYFMGVDQIQNLIDELKTNPDSRRMMVSAWNVEDMDEMTLPPCHYGFQVYTRELTFKERLTYYDPLKLYHNEVDSWFLDDLNIPKRLISLMWNQRSVDTFLGLPFNIASYGLLLTMIANEVNMIPCDLIGSLGDTHLYVDHIDAAKEQINRTPFDLPTLEIKCGINCSNHKDIKIMGYQSHPTIKAKLLN